MLARGRDWWTPLATAILAAVALRLAWVGDDAYITLRTVENLCDGHGPVWNVGERVQTYTHPLWLLVLTCGRLLTGECYFATIALGAVGTVAAAFLLLRAAGGPWPALAMLAMLAFARGFSEYAICGLENPLAFALLAAFGVVVTGDDGPDRRCRRAALLAGLLATTRLDLALLVAPAVLVCARGLHWSTAARHLATGALPLLLWLLFATAYYGTPLPITAYAKVFHGLPAHDLVLQGLRHLRYALLHDPVQTTVVVAGIAVGAGVPRLRARALALGIALYCGYVVRIGGDFMATRFHSPPFVLAAVIAARALAGSRPPLLILLAAASVACGLLPGLPPWLLPPSAEPSATAADAAFGIVDERAVYFASCGLFAPHCRSATPGMVTNALHSFGRERLTFVVAGTVGRFGYEAGELVHIVDPWLCDPLLMRLPVGRPEGWRIGHFERLLPIGYLETLAHGHNVIHHAGLARVHDTLHAVLTEPLFAASRWRALWRWWTGACDADLAAFVADEYRTPPRVDVAATELATVLPATIGGYGAYWFDHPGARVVCGGGLAVHWPGPCAARAVRLQAIGDADCLLRFRRDGAEVGVQGVRCEAAQGTGMAQLEAAVPTQVGTFDTLWLDFVNRRSLALDAIGSVVLVP